MGMKVDQVPPSEALPGVGNHSVVFHNGLGFYYVCKQFARELEKRLFECMKPGCRVTATMGKGCGSPLIDSGKHSHPPDLDYRNKCLLLHEIRQRFSMQEISASVVLKDALSSLNEEEFQPPNNFECVTLAEPSSPMLSEENVNCPLVMIKEELEEPVYMMIKEEVNVMDDETDGQNNTDDETDDQNNMDDQNEHAILDLGENIDPSTDSVAIIDPSESETIITCGDKLNSFRVNADRRNSRMCRKKEAKKPVSFSEYLGQGLDVEDTSDVSKEKAAAGTKRNNVKSGKLQLTLSGRYRKNAAKGNSALTNKEEASLIKLQGRVKGYVSGRCPRNLSRQNPKSLKENEHSRLERLRGELEENLSRRRPRNSYQESSTLSDQDESSLVQRILMLGFPISKKQMITFAANWAKHLQKKFAPNLVWLRGFIKRHPVVETAIRENVPTNNSYLMSQRMRQVNKHHRRHPYSQAHLDKAVQMVKSGMSMSSASNKFGIPASTLRDRVRGRYCNRVLSLEEESSIVERVTSMLNLGFPVSSEQLMKIVADQIKELNKMEHFPNGGPNLLWLSKFLLRHPDLANRLSTSDISEKELTEWFCETL